MTGIKMSCLHPDSWSMDLLESKEIDQDQISIILCGAYAAWSERNARKHGEKERSVPQSVKWAIDIVSDLQKVSKEKKIKHAKIKPRWKPPDATRLKINVDASFSETDNEGSTGVCVRDHTGKLMRAQAIWYDSIADAKTMEAMAIRDGAQLAADLGYRDIIIESDAEQVVKMMNSGMYDRTEAAAVYHVIKELCGIFNNCQLVFVGREANNLAHLCCKRANSSRRRCLWVNYIPDFLADCIAHDCNPVI